MLPAAVTDSAPEAAAILEAETVVPVDEQPTCKERWLAAPAFESADVAAATRTAAVTDTVAAVLPLVELVAALVAAVAETGFAVAVAAALPAAAPWQAAPVAASF